MGEKKFEPYGWIRNEEDHERWVRLKEHFAAIPLARHLPTGMLVQFVRYSIGGRKTAGTVICRDLVTGGEHVLSGVLLEPLTEMEVVAHAAR